MDKLINYNILQIEGKDILNSGDKGYKLKKNKKYKATFDASLDIDKIIEVAKEVYSENEYNKIFFTEIGKYKTKYKTKAVVSMRFKYTVKAYNKQTINKQSIYVYYDYFEQLKEMDFLNGLCIKSIKLTVDNEETEIEIPVAIMVDKPIDKTKITIEELPKGFTVSDENMIIADESKMETAIDTAGIREKLYTNGAVIDGRKYVRYKRSSGSSKEGKCLFILEPLYKKLMSWTEMNLDLPENVECDLAGLESYFSLTTSSIIDYIEIKPENILLIPEWKSEFKDTVIATRMENILDEQGKEILDDEGKPKQKLVTRKEDNVDISNNLWDGQSIIDSSIMGKYSKYGFILIRNRFVKSACFQADIQQFFSDNGITCIEQLNVNGKTIATNLSQIKLITTKSSIKYLKYNSWKNYISKCSSTYGIVKFEKPQHYDERGTLVQSHYQLINTLELDEDKVKQLLQPSMDYIKLLKNDIRVFRHYLGLKIDSDIKMGEINSADDLIMTMLQVNDDINRTDMFVNFRQDLVDNYVKNIRKGHILIHGTYAVMCSCGLEMLMHSIRDKNDPSKSMFEGSNNCQSVLPENTVFCLHFTKGEKLIGSRSPHVASGNILITKNIHSSPIRKYFKDSYNVVHVSPIGNNIMERLSSCDFDSDAILLSNEKLLYDLGKKNYNRFLVPTSKCDIPIKKRLPTIKEKIALDIKCEKTQSVLGDVVNTSQMLNSKMWQMLKEDKNTNIDEIYRDICQLDILSTLVIDSSKKEYPLDFKFELETIRNKYVKKELSIAEIKEIKDRKGNKKKKYRNTLAPKTDRQEYERVKDSTESEDIKSYSKLMEKYSLKTVRPNFFKYVGKGKDYLFLKMDGVPMDILERKITEMLPDTRAKSRTGDNKPIALGELFNNDIKLKSYNSKQVESIINKCRELKVKVDEIWQNENMDGEEKWKESNELKDNFAESLPNTIMISSLKKILYDYNEAAIKYDAAIKTNRIKKKNGQEVSEVKKDEILSFGRILLTALFKRYPDKFETLFIHKKQPIETINRLYRETKDDDEIIEFYGMKYIVIRNNF